MEKMINEKISERLDILTRKINYEYEYTYECGHQHREEEWRLIKDEINLLNTICKIATTKQSKRK